MIKELVKACHSREGGNPRWRGMDSRLRGNDRKRALRFSQLVPTAEMFARFQSVNRAAIRAFGAACATDI